MDAITGLSFMYQLIQAFSKFGGWLIQPLFPNVPELALFSPLTLFTFGGITAFIAVAIIKWVVS